MLLTARLIKESCSIPFIYRAGVWKPRTNPSSFQGVGKEALVWLQEVKEQFGIDIATEVAIPEHVTAALSAGVDYLWIGARTSANPIAVQEIADAISAFSTKPKAVLVKNPVNEDAQLWLGNIERIERTGVSVMAVHRGCNHQPCWAMAHLLRITRPEIPLLLDPSHMSGDAEKVPALLHKVSRLGLNGTMIEVHCHPHNALSDAKQQLSARDTDCLIAENLRKQEEHPIADVELEWLRAEIDELDEQLWSTITKRMDVSKRIGEWKKEAGMQPLQPERYAQIVRKWEEWGEEHGLTPSFVLQILDVLHNESLKKQV